MKNEEMMAQMAVLNARKSTAVAYLLLIVLGGVGAHRFYLGRNGSAIGQLILGILSVLSAGALLLPLIIWIFVDLFLIPGIIRDNEAKVRMDVMLRSRM